MVPLYKRTSVLRDVFQGEGLQKYNANYSNLRILKWSKQVLENVAIDRDGMLGDNKEYTTLCGLDAPALLGSNIGAMIGSMATKNFDLVGGDMSLVYHLLNNTKPFRKGENDELPRIGTWLGLQRG
jgi:hypothetical protein